VQPTAIDCETALARLGQFDAVVDARSPAEFADDRLPGAISCPVLDDAQRADIGALYRHASAFEARRLGAAYVASNIAAHLRTVISARPRDWSAIVYCWRGGERSAALAHVLARVGWRVHPLEGGYRSFRRHVMHELGVLPGRFDFRVLCGATGSGKSRLLLHLRRAGAQVLDLETIACHRGSVLGGLPGRPQPGQRHFETRLWWALRALDPSQPVFVESESRRIGSRQLPDGLLDAIRSAACVSIDMSFEERVRLLRQEYLHFEVAPERLFEQLRLLRELHGAARLGQWQELALRGQWSELVEALLRDHYDPLYRRSLARNFGGGSTAAVILKVDTADDAAFDRAAEQLAGAWRRPA
jgi:tRNA 2-selenouridine synthase